MSCLFTAFTFRADDMDPYDVAVDAVFSGTYSEYVTTLPCRGHLLIDLRSMLSTSESLLNLERI